MQLPGAAECENMVNTQTTSKELCDLFGVDIMAGRGPTYLVLEIGVHAQHLGGSGVFLKSIG